MSLVETSTSTQNPGKSSMSRRRYVSLASFFALSAAAASLTGCGLSTSASDAPAQVTTASGAKGIFMGGQQPVGGVAIRVYQTGSTYGGASTAASPVRVLQFRIAFPVLGRRDCDVLEHVPFHTVLAPFKGSDPSTANEAPPEVADRLRNAEMSRRMNPVARAKRCGRSRE